MKRLSTYLLLLAMFAVLTTSCTNVIDPNGPSDGTSYRAESNFSFTIGVDDKSKLELNSISGNVQVIGVANTENVIVAGTKVVKSDNEMDAESYLKNLRVSLAESGNTLYVASEQPDETHGREVQINYEIQVPAWWATAIENINGNIQLDSLNGEILGKVTNGNLFLGHIGSSATLRVTNGQITGNIVLPQNGVLNGQVENGQILLNVPKTTSAVLTAKVVNGTVNVTGLSVINMIGNSKQIQGTLGTGAGKIELASTNGNISVVGY